MHWDGAQWTEHYEPAEDAAVSSLSSYSYVLMPVRVSH